jgi:PAS domain S-box-containing protein
MEIKDFNFLSFSNTYDKSHYFNNLIIQERDEFRLHYFSDMEGIFRVNKIKYMISSGSFFITHPGDHFSITSVKSERTLGYFMVILHPEKKERVFFETELTRKSYTINSNQRMVLEEVLGKLNSQNLYIKESARYQILSFLYDLPNYQKQIQKYPDHHRYIEKALKYMQERVFEELHLKELCSYICISEPHCIRLFKGRMGTTPMKYFSRIKIEEAVNLLLTTNKPLGLIAEELQFSSAAHFSKTFKQYLSISPTQYRNNYINTLEHRQRVTIKERENAYDLLQNIIDASPDLIFFKDTHGVLMGGNKAFYNIMGRSREELVGKSDYEFFPKESADFFQKRDDMIFKNNRAIKNEEVMTYPNGRRRTFEVYKAPFTDDQGKVTGLIGISRDITDRINTRQALVSSQTEQKQLSTRHAEVLTNLAEQLLELLKESKYSNQKSFEFLQPKLLTEGLNSFIQSIFNKNILNNRGTDPKILFENLEKLFTLPLPLPLPLRSTTNTIENSNLIFNIETPKNLPDIVFIDDKRLLRAFYFLIRSLTLNITNGTVSINSHIRKMTLIMHIRLNSKLIPDRKRKKIEKLIQREEGLLFIPAKEDPIELCLANLELECLKSKIILLSNSPKLIEIEVSTPFPYGIEYLNQYYDPKNSSK